MRKILLVEDEDMLRNVYLSILSTEPYHIEAAKNGQEALDKCSHTSYDLILLDLMMPVLDGIGFLERFDTENHPGTKIIILSNLSSSRELRKAMDLGAYRNILKVELSPRQLLSTVRYEIDAAM